MKLIAAPGSQEMQDALANRHVRMLVDILLRFVANDFFILVAQFLKKHKQSTSTDFLKDLQALKSYSHRLLDEQGQLIHISHLMRFAKPSKDCIMEHKLPSIFAGVPLLNCLHTG